jgi:hypothetical protein
MPDEKHAETKADAKIAPIVTPPAPSTVAPHPENKPEGKLPVPAEKTPAVGTSSEPVTALSPKAKEVTAKAKDGEAQAQPVWDRASVLVDDLVDFLAFKGVLSHEDVVALADPSIGGTTVHRADRLRPRFDPAMQDAIAKAREARRVRADLIASYQGGPPKTDRSGEDLGEIADAPPAAFFRPSAG